VAQESLLLTPILIRTTWRCSRSVSSLFIPDVLRIRTVPGRSEQLVWCHTRVCFHHRSSYYLQNRFNSPLVSTRGKTGLFLALIALFSRWGFIVSCLLAVVSILFFGSLFAMTGLAFIIQPFVQMIGGFLHPGKPMANMYFVLFSYSESRMSFTTNGPPCLIHRKIDSVTQAGLLLRDLKIAQCRSYHFRISEFSFSSSVRYETPPSRRVHRSDYRHVTWFGSEL
jgi:OPT oligopeptide transporter protein